MVGLAHFSIGYVLTYGLNGLRGSCSRTALAQLTRLANTYSGHWHIHSDPSAAHSDRSIYPYRDDQAVLLGALRFRLAFKSCIPGAVSVRRYRLQAKAHKGIVLVAQLWVLATSNPTGDRYSCRDHALHRHTEAQSNIHSPLRWYIHPKVRSLQGGHIMWFIKHASGMLSIRTFGEVFLGPSIHRSLLHNAPPT